MSTNYRALHQVREPHQAALAETTRQLLGTVRFSGFISLEESDCAKLAPVLLLFFTYVVQGEELAFFGSRAYLHHAASRGWHGLKCKHAVYKRLFGMKN